MKLLNLKKTVYLFLSITILLFSSCNTEETILLEEDASNTGKKELLSSDLLAKSSNSVQLSYNSISASTQQSANPIGNIDDNSMSTRWSGYGNSVHVDIDFGTVVRVDYIKLALHKGDERTTSFDYLESSNGSSYTKKGGKTSSGNTESHEEFDLSNMDTRYLRLTFKGNSVSDWNSVLDLEIYGTGGTTGGGSGSGSGNSSTPGGVLNIDNDDWKLNGFTATPSSSATYYDDVMSQVNGNISTWSNSNYFYENNGWAYFKCYRGLGGSANSGNPRVELRERINGSNASWNGDNGTHTMSFTVRVDQLPIGYDSDDNEDRTTGTLCFAQIHGPSGTNSDGVDVDDLIRLQFDGSAGQTSGSVKLKISGYITETQGGGSESFTGYSLDTSYDFQLIFSNDRVSVKINGSEVFGRTLNTAGNGSYFKIGNYLQSVQEGSFNGSYGLVGIKNLTVSH
ncbi:MAG: polysaccharide lyase family 7 protein [Polaribacter sp.]|uniref:polysaccharide lyase family 7 protein n=1 Tax=Polaribacter sp. TaxID=1920175 RepID=UPI0032648D97